MSVSACLVLFSVLVLVFVMQAKKKRARHGTYNPQKKEEHLGAPNALEMAELKIKLPAEERLI
jgi:hypothetical protein